MPGLRGTNEHAYIRPNQRAPKKARMAGAGDVYSASTPGTSSTNVSSLTTSSMSKLLTVMTTSADAHSGKRSTSASYRLHSAKYLKMDAMLKQLMFPLHRFRGFFGYVQTSGQGLNVSVPGTTNDINKLAPRSSFRSISFFKLRHTKPRYLPGYPDSSNNGQAQILNGSRVTVGTTDITGASENINTYFRRFNNTPKLASGNGAGGAPENLATGVAAMSADPGNYRQLALDFNTADIERTALQASSFVPNPLALAPQAGTSIGTNEWVPGNDTGPQVYTGQADQGFQTKSAWKDAVVRIADGTLTLDVQNGSRVPTVCELVIHSMKKDTPGATNKTFGTTEIYSSIWKAANFSAGTKTPFNDTAAQAAGVAGAAQGGWSTFWDPKTPFLKVPAAQSKLVENICNEVHRSVHIIAPGESKCIKLQLGSLYYKLGQRSGYYDESVGNSESINTLIDGPGTLAVALGAFGVDCLETAFSDGVPGKLTQSGASNALEGTGFWIGKSPAPSHIVVAGKYEEAFYPAYLNREQMQLADATAPLPSVLESERTIPLGTIAPIQVSSMDGNSYFDPVGGGKAPVASQESI